MKNGRTSCPAGNAEYFSVSLGAALDDVEIAVIGAAASGSTSMRSSRLRPYSSTCSWVLLYLAVAGACAIPRFGQLENASAGGQGDSIYYLDMAAVFAGERARFNPAYDPEGRAARFYNRPLAPFLAGTLARYLLPGNHLVSFTILNILAATLVAVLLMQHIRSIWPEWNLFWLPSLLYLSAFPQINWGYHALTDGVGMATAFLAAYYVYWLSRGPGARSGMGRRQWTLHLAALFVISAMAFLARETGWLVPIVAVYLLSTWRRHQQHGWVKPLLILGIVLLAKLPHGLYTHVLHLQGASIAATFAGLTDWRYLTDCAFKIFICFNFSWILAGWGWRQLHWVMRSDLILAWTLAALAYLGAGYLHNAGSVFFSPRFAFALFPVVFILAAVALDRSVNPKFVTSSVLAYVAVQIGINVFGVWLDSESTIGVTIFTVLHGYFGA